MSLEVSLELSWISKFVTRSYSRIYLAIKAQATTVVFQFSNTTCHSSYYLTYKGTLFSILCRPLQVIYPETCQVPCCFTEKLPDSLWLLLFHHTSFDSDESQLHVTILYFSLWQCSALTHCKSCLQEPCFCLTCLFLLSNFTSNSLFSLAFQLPSL